MSPSRSLVALAAAAAVAVPGAATAGAAVSPPGAAPAPLAPSLSARLAHAEGPLPVLVTMRAQVPEEGYSGRPGALIGDLRRTAERTRPAALGRIGSPARRLWLVNAVALRARPAQIRRLAADPAVARIELDRPVRVLARAAEAAAAPAPGLFERGGWGLAAIGAPAVWRDYGLDGAGVRVGSIDSGVDADHPDLKGKVVAWRDFVNGRPAPYDDNGHGTHTIGTMVGGSAGGAPIGVAPGAKVVVAKALPADGKVTISTLLAAAQWITDPDGNPMTDDAPQVVNASWGTALGEGGEPLRRLIARWRELGIVPVAAAGNTGPEGTVLAPAVYPESLAVGALGPWGGVAPTSARGAPGPTAALKPDLAAPGRQIVSAEPGGGWLRLSGTSMAAPHVAGAIALLRQADPALSVNRIEQILRETARDAGAPGPDRRSGAGAIDLQAAAAELLGPRSPRSGISLSALPPALTNRAVLTFAIGGADGPLGVWLDGVRVGHQRVGPLVRVPVRASAGRHTVAVAALDPASGAPGGAQRFWVTIDRQAPRLRLVVRPTGMLDIDYRARATDASGVADGSLSSRLSDGGDPWIAPEGRHSFTGPGPYWVEARVVDRAGNVRRVRRILSWPSAPLARRLARDDAMLTLEGPFGTARLHRRVNGRYPDSRRLARLLGANWEPASFVAVPDPAAPLPSKVVGVWSDGDGRLVLATDRAGRRYVMEDREGRVSSGVRAAA